MTGEHNTITSATHINTLREAAGAARAKYEAAKRDPLASNSEIARAKREHHDAHEKWLDAATDAASPAFANGNIITQA